MVCAPLLAVAQHEGHEESHDLNQVEVHHDDAHHDAAHGEDAHADTHADHAAHDEHGAHGEEAHAVSYTHLTLPTKRIV